jgi:hypothetical protein
MDVTTGSRLYADFNFNEIPSIEGGYMRGRLQPVRGRNRGSDTRLKFKPIPRHGTVAESPEPYRYS